MRSIVAVAFAALMALPACAGTTVSPDRGSDASASLDDASPTHPIPQSALPSASASPPPSATPSSLPTAAPSRAAADSLLGELAAADDAAGLAAQIEAAERAIRADGTDPARLERAGRLQQLAYRRLSREAGLRERVAALLADDLRSIADANVRAGEQLRSTVTSGAELPEWTIVEPAPPDQLLAHYREAQESFGVGWEYLAAIHLVETRMGRIRGDSVAGAQGPMQFMPQTWDAYGQGDVHDNRDAILAAARYLADHGAPGDMPRALWHYNHSDAYVAAVSAYAEQMRADPRVFYGYYHWQVFFATAEGDVLLEVGYPN
ncbi:MAG TPA: lytic transglycosylase domain-containing protein [Egibacteraceae bacterium]|nr:lytic transglycosylase domain-containing protein [Egibacteraceae bacterium]